MVFHLYLERIIVENLLSAGLINYKRDSDSVDAGILGFRMTPDFYFAISRTESRNNTLTYHLAPLNNFNKHTTFTAINKIVFTKNELSRDEYESLTGYKVLNVHGNLINRETIPTILYEMYCNDDIVISGFLDPVALYSFRDYKNSKLSELNKIYKMINNCDASI
jgi:hypothetical protein